MGPIVPRLVFRSLHRDKLRRILRRVCLAHERAESLERAARILRTRDRIARRLAALTR